jgi:hypothetical protein
VREIRIAAVAAAVLLAWLTYVLVEQPIPRRGARYLAVVLLVGEDGRIRGVAAKVKPCKDGGQGQQDAHTHGAILSPQVRYGQRFRSAVAPDIWLVVSHYNAIQRIGHPQAPGLMPQPGLAH